MSENTPRREYIFSTYVRNRNNDMEDCVFVKEHLHYPDGTIKPNLRRIKNYVRPFYVTKPMYRDHQQKKEFEYFEKLDEYRCIQSQLVRKASNVLGMYGCYKLSQVANSPYIYGCDVDTTTLIAKEYLDNEPTLTSPAVLAVGDYETDMLSKDGTIIIGTISCKEKATVSIRRDFLQKNNLPTDDDELITLVRKRMDELIGDVIKERNIDVEIKIQERNVDVAKDVLGSAHKWQPDFLGFWNMSFDMDHMVLACKLNNIDPALLFSDPSIPMEYKNFYYRKDLPKKTKSDGSTSVKHVADLWHIVKAPATFQCVDMMSFYKHNRVREQQLNSYSLDAILERHTNISKLKFKEVEGLDPKDWHVVMQRDYPLEYISYALMDVIACEILDEVTRDISHALRPAMRISGVDKLKSVPGQRADGFHFTLLEEGKVIGSTAETMEEVYCRHVPKSSGWINSYS